MGRRAIEYTQAQHDMVRSMWNCRHSLKEISQKAGISARSARLIAQVEGLGRKPNHHFGQWRPSLVGRVYGRLTITRIDEENDNRLHARCICGTEYSYWITDLLAGHTRSCGCLRREVSSMTIEQKKARRNTKIDTI